MSVVALNLIEGLVGHVLALDGETSSQFRTLEGRVLAIEVLGTTIRLQVHCVATGLRLSREDSIKPDVTISGTPLELLAQLSPLRASGARPTLRIVGDVELAQEFQRIVRGIEPDWEEALAGWLGDSAAHRIGNVLRAGRRMARESRRNFVQDLSEYLRYEQDLLPERSDIDRFAGAVDRLREDADRLRARLQRVAGATAEDGR